MMRLKILTGIFAIALFSSNAFASVITYQTRAFESSNFDNSDYKTSWNDHTSSISTSVLSNFTGISSGHNTFSHLEVSFDLGNVDSIKFQFGLDAGYGEELVFDNTTLDKNVTNLWWRYNWDHSHVVEVTINPLTMGNHELDLYWAEGCCNGYNSGRFSVDEGATWLALSTSNLDAAYVPEPSVLILMGAGLVGLGYTRRRKQSA